MKIVFIDPNNSTPRLSYPLLESLQNDNLNIKFYTAFQADITDYYQQNYAANAEYIFFKHSNLISNKFLRKFIKFFSYPATMKLLLLKFIKNKPDVIHLNWINFPLFDLFFIKIMQLLGCKVILTRHNYIAHSGNKLRIFEKAIFLQLDMILCLSEYVKNCFDPKLHSKIKIIEHGNCFAKEIEKFQNAKTQNTGFLKLLYFGSIKHYKGVDLLIRAMKILSDDNPLYRLKILGFAKKRIYFELDKIIKFLKLEKFIEYENKYAKYSEMFEEIQNCDLGVLPYRESTQSSLPYAFIAFRKPLLVTSAGGLNEQVSAEFSEVAQPDPMSIARGIQKIVSKNVKDSSFSDYLKIYKWENTVNKYQDLYRGLLDAAD